MTVLIQLGSCGASWPQNTTPIQRLTAISPYFDRVVLVDTAADPSPFVRCDDYVRLRGFTLSSIRRIVRNNRDDRVVIWFGPSARLAIIIIILRLFLRFHFVVDLYDHEQLSSGIARARGARLKSLKYRLFESFTVLAAWRADLLVSAIAEERYESLPNRVKAVNGVATEQFSAFSKPTDPNTTSGPSDVLTVCYVGLTNGERAGILEDLAAACYGKPVEFLLIGDNDPTFIDLLRRRATLIGDVSIVAPGFLPWAEAMRLVAKSDLCLYVFPTRPELDCVYPIKIGEYMELQKPVVATNTTAIREVYSECPGVIRCDTDHPQQWISAIQALADDTAKRQTLGAANRAFVRDRLDWSITQAKLLARLDALLATNSYELQR